MIVTSDSKKISYFKMTAGVKLVEVPEGLVAFAQGSAEVHYLNHVAAIVLILCDGSISTDDIVKIIKEEFNLNSNPKEEVRRCLVELSGLGLIEKCGVP